MATNGSERPLPPWLVLGDPIRRDLPVVHHRRLEKAGLGQRHVDVEWLELVPQGFCVSFQRELAGGGTWQPLWESNRAVDCPTPDDAPVISTTLCSDTSDLLYAFRVRPGTPDQLPRMLTGKGPPLGSLTGTSRELHGRPDIDSGLL